MSEGGKGGKGQCRKNRHSSARGIYDFSTIPNLSSGVALNGVLWVMGPQNPKCDPGSCLSRPECLSVCRVQKCLRCHAKGLYILPPLCRSLHLNLFRFLPAKQLSGKGVVFDFTVSPWSGKLFPILFQMWYCAMLIVLMLINWPLFAYLHQKRCHVAILGVQLVITGAIIAAFALLGRDEIEQPLMVASMKVVCEAGFLGIAVLTRPEYRPSWLPLRFVHYLLGLMMFLAFGCTPISPRIESISAVPEPALADVVLEVH